MRLITHSFFKFIFFTFGTFPLRFMKLWMKQRKIIIMNKCINFLKFCIEYNIVPQHLHRIHHYNINITYFNSIKRYTQIYTERFFAIKRLN